MTQVVVGLSGGVDSAVAAFLLKEQGFKVLGLFMKNWEDDDEGEYCSSRQDLIDVLSIADRIGVEVEVVNFAKAYKERVFSAFLKEYEAGRTPNPDVLCNSEIKFRAFLDHAITLGATKIATGHYAGVLESSGDFLLLKGEDPNKDQSYFLHRLNQAQLSKSLFPISTLPKGDVRKIAHAAKIPVADKKDSTGICFIGERPFKAFLMRYLPTKKGEIRRLEDNLLLGEHDGLAYHTLGQRKGLKIGGTHQSANKSEHAPWFVARKDMTHNVLYVVQGHDHPALLSHTVRITSPSWILGSPPDLSKPYAAKTRYRQKDAACQLLDHAEEGATIYFKTPQWAVTPGQSLVLYEGNICLGGGVIAASEP